MKGSFRQSMSWLHTWVGLVAGWILFFVFVTGTASYATQEITRWMQPERPMQGPTNLDITAQFDAAYQQLLHEPRAQEAQSWTINFVSNARNSQQLSASWSMPAAEGERRGRTETIYLNHQTGAAEPLTEQPRETAGGRALLRMHYALHYIPSDTAILIVGVCTMLMLIALVTGVIAHKKILQDFFTYRPAKNLRSWLDAHNVVSIAALPFFLMITYSGLIFFLYTYMPLGVPFTYGFSEQDQQTYYQELVQQTGSQRILGLGGGGGPPRQIQGAGERPRMDGAMPTEPQSQRGRRAEQTAQGAGSEHHTIERANRSGQGRREHRGDGTATIRVAAGLGMQAKRFVDVVPLLLQVEQQWGVGRVRSLTMTPSLRGEPAKIQFSPAFSETIRRSRGAGNIEFNALTGAEIKSSPNELATPEVFGSSMLGLHEGLFAGTAVRWMYLISGLLGCAMIATGLVVWTVKRRPKLEKTGEYRAWHQAVERLNVATIAGLSFGLACYFWANRLLPAELAERQQWEIHLMFICWALLAAYCMVRPVMLAWRDSLIVTSAAFLFLPLLNGLTTERHLLNTIAHGDWVLVSIDLVFIALGLMFGWAALKVREKGPQSGKARKAQKVQAEQTMQTTEGGI